MLETKDFEVNGAEPVKKHDILALTNAIDVSTDGANKPADVLVPIRASRPKSKRPARMLDVEKLVDAQTPPKPDHIERDRVEISADVPEKSGSKLSVTTNILSSVKSRFQKADKVETPDVDVPEVDIESAEQDLAKPSRVSVLAKAKESWSKTKAVGDLDVDLDTDDDLREDAVADFDVMAPQKVRFLARFDTPVMGVAAGIAVSCVAMFVVSSFLA